MNKVTIYTSTHCPLCGRLKSFLNAEHIEFTEINIDNHPEELTKLVNTTGQLGVPQTKINSRWIMGFNPTNILKILAG